MRYRDLTIREEAFVEFFCSISKFNFNDAADRALLTKKQRLLCRRDPAIAWHINRKNVDALAQEGLTQGAIVGELSKIAFSDVTTAFKEGANWWQLKNIDDIPEELKACIKKVKYSEDGVQLEFHDKTKALEIMARMSGLMKDDVAVTLDASERFDKLLAEIEKVRDGKV